MEQHHIWQRIHVRVPLHQKPLPNFMKGYVRSLNANEIITPKDCEHFIFQIADGTAKLSGRDHGIRKSNLMRDRHVRSEDPRGDLQKQFGEVSTNGRNSRWRWSPQRFLVNRGGFHLSSSRRTSNSALSAERRNIYNSTEIHWCDQNYPYKPGCVARKPYWRYRTVDVNRNLSDSWTGFTKFTILHEKAPKVYMWSYERLSKIQATTRPDHLWRSKAAQRKEKQQWIVDKPKLDNTRKLRGIYFIDPDDVRVQGHH